MALKCLRPRQIHIKKVWICDDDVCTSETSSDDYKVMDSIIETLDKASSFDGFYPLKPETPSYLISFIDDGHTEEVTVKADLVLFEDGERLEMPEGKFLMANLLDRIIGKSIIERARLEDVYLQMVGS